MFRDSRIKDTHHGSRGTRWSAPDHWAIAWGRRRGCAKSRRKYRRRRDIAKLFKGKEGDKSTTVSRIDSYKESIPPERTRSARLAPLKLQSWTPASIGAEPNPQSPIFPTRILHSPLHVNSARATMESVNWRGSVPVRDKLFPPVYLRNTPRLAGNIARIGRSRSAIVLRSLLSGNKWNKRATLRNIYRCARNNVQEMRSSASRSFYLWISEESLRWQQRDNKRAIAAPSHVPRADFAGARFSRISSQSLQLQSRSRTEERLHVTDVYLPRWRGIRS